MANLLEYKGYYAKVEYSPEDKTLFGRIEGLRDLVTFESDTTDGVETAFHAAVDDYLAFCADLGTTPDKAYRGAFNVRISPDLHRRAAAAALSQGVTLNSFVAASIEQAVKNA